jgi:hypothetical protein
LTSNDQRSAMDAYEARHDLESTLGTTVVLQGYATLKARDA